MYIVNDRVPNGMHTKFTLHQDAMTELQMSTSLIRPNLGYWKFLA